MCLSVRGCPVIAYVHGDCMNYSWMKNIVLAQLHTLKKAKEVLCVSKTAKNSFEKLTNIPASVCYNPIDCERIVKLSQENIPNTVEEPYVLAVGRLYPEKGFDRLVKIWKKIINCGLKYKLVIVGEGEQRNKLEQLIEENGLSDNVKLMGYCENPYPYISSAHLMVCSSYSEGLPVTMMEALVLGVPIISSYPSVGELLGNEKCGIITENTDEALEQGLLTVLRDNDLYTELKNGAVKMSEYYKSDKLIKNVENIYNKVLFERKN